MLSYRACQQEQPIVILDKDMSDCTSILSQKWCAPSLAAACWHVLRKTSQIVLEVVLADVVDSLTLNLPSSTISLQ